MNSPSRHYTDEPAHLCASVVTDRELGVPMAHIRGAGFLTAAMVTETLHGLGETRPSRLLVDLRDVAGYDAGCVTIAHRWLTIAREQGIRRVAFVATSSVLQTAARVVDPRSSVRLRAFASEPAARAWLQTHQEPLYGVDVTTRGL